MEQHRLDKLKELLSIPTSTWKEDKLIEYVCEELMAYDGVKFFTDEYGSIYIEKGLSEIYPCVVAHLDTVHGLNEIIVKEETLKNAQGEDKLSLRAYDKDSGDHSGIGGDDKAGVFICLELLKKMDTLKVFLPVAEETGCHGTRKAQEDFFENVGYAIQFDSTENNTMSKSLLGVKLYEEESDFFQKTKGLILEHGFSEWKHHPYTDTMVLKQRFDFPCLNFAAGYYEYHTKYEYVVVEDVENAINLGEKVINKLGNQKYLYKFEKDDKRFLW